MSEDKETVQDTDVSVGTVKNSLVSLCRLGVKRRSGPRDKRWFVVGRAEDPTMWEIANGFFMEFARCFYDKWTTRTVV